MQRAYIQRHGLTIPALHVPYASLLSTELEASHAFHVFTRKCAIHIETHAPCSVIAVIRLEPGLGEDRIFDLILQCARWTEEYKPGWCSPEPLGWMLKDGKSVEVLRRPGLEVADLAYMKDRMDEIEGQFWLDDVDADEWKRDWEEGDVIE